MFSLPQSNVQVFNYQSFPHSHCPLVIQNPFTNYTVNYLETDSSLEHNSVLEARFICFSKKQANLQKSRPLVGFLSKKAWSFVTLLSFLQRLHYRLKHTIFLLLFLLTKTKIYRNIFFSTRKLSEFKLRRHYLSPQAASTFQPIL